MQSLGQIKLSLQGTGLKMDTLNALVFLCVASAASGMLFEDKVCYGSLGCFTNDKPFDNAYGELPDSPDEIQVRCYLWAQDGQDVGQEIDYQSNMTAASFNAQRPTKILIHGFESSKDASPVVANLSKAFLKQGDYNVIGVDWSAGAKKAYPKAVANTRVVGAVITRLVDVLKYKFDLKVKDLHLIGHSLGAHIAGYVGQKVPGLSRITGLDPAGPMFTGTDVAVRLDASDAVFVDVIHSDGGPLIDAGFGTMQQLGHIDFYPNGGATQPGCPAPIETTLEDLMLLHLSDAFDTISCGHDRAIWYFIESVLSTDCRFQSYPCGSWADFQAGSCGTCRGSPCPDMGLDSAATDTARGSFYLKTNSQTPFCRV